MVSICTNVYCLLNLLDKSTFGKINIYLALKGPASAVDHLPLHSLSFNTICFHSSLYIILIKCHLAINISDTSMDVGNNTFSSLFNRALSIMVATFDVFPLQSVFDTGFAFEHFNLSLHITFIDCHFTLHIVNTSMDIDISSSFSQELILFPLYISIHATSENTDCHTFKENGEQALLSVNLFFSKAQFQVCSL